MSLALKFLKETLISTETSVAICDRKLIFFGTQDYLETGSINKCPRMSVSIDDLVK